ncbi:MAG: ABC transporter permease, partial [Gemmatimonadaceae bacterium]
MTRPNGWRRYVRIFGNNPDADVDAELQFHLEMRARELSALGMPMDAALEEARRRFGDMERVRAECRRLERTKERRAARLRSLGDFMRDLGFAIRSLIAQPVFTIAAVLTLGLGIGVNAAIFSTVNAYLIKPLPVRDPERLITVVATLEGDNLVSQMSIPNFRDITGLKRVFDDAVIFGGDDVAFGTGEQAVRSFAMTTSGNYFTVLGVTPAIGRYFTAEDERQRAAVMVLNDVFWRRRYNADRGVIGKTEMLNGIPFTIIGVAPPEFFGTMPLLSPDYYIPMESKVLYAPEFQGSLEDRAASGYRVLAYLHRGATLEQARTQLATLGRELQAKWPNSNRGMGFAAEFEVKTRPEYAIARVMPWVAGIFLGLVGLALLVACANVTNLLLARAAARAGEIAVRSALGATPGRLVRLLLAESLAISIAALVVAVLFARGAIAWLNGQPIEVDVPIHFGITLDWRVFAYTASVALAAGVIAGIAPALIGTRIAVSETLKQGGRSGSAGHSRSRFRSSLVVVQMAVSFILLVSASLFTRSVRSAMRSDLGFSNDGILMATTNLGLYRMDSSQIRRFQETLLEKTRATPGVTEAALASNVPFSG